MWNDLYKKKMKNMNVFMIEIANPMLQNELKHFISIASTWMNIA